jgi:uncharacterized protein (DUF305 family)
MILAMIGKIDPLADDKGFYDDWLPKDHYAPEKKKSSPGQQQRGLFFGPPVRQVRPRPVDKTKARDYLTRAVQLEADAITTYEKQIRYATRPDVRRLLNQIVDHQKQDLAELSRQLLKILPGK